MNGDIWVDPVAIVERSVSLKRNHRSTANAEIFSDTMPDFASTATAARGAEKLNVRFPAFERSQEDVGSTETLSILENDDGLAVSEGVLLLTRAD